MLVESFAIFLLVENAKFWNFLNIKIDFFVLNSRERAVS